MSIIPMLRERKADLQRQMQGLQTEIDQIDVAMSAIANSATNATTGNVEGALSKPTIDEAIILAIAAGNGTPKRILNYIANELGIDTTINSVRTRVSRLRSRNLIAHNGHTWIPTP